MKDASSPALDGYARPEMEIILCCARSQRDEQARDLLLELLKCELDWGLLLRAAYVHGVMPFLYRGLRDEAADRIPPAVHQVLQRHYMHSVARSTFLTEKLFGLLRLFAAHHIDAVPLKGPVLAATVYDLPALREFEDLDIMVRRSDVHRAVDLLTSMDYRPFSKSTGPEDIDDLLKSRLRKDAGFVHKDGQVFVEIHWDFLPAARTFPLGAESAWSSCEDIDISGNKLPTFAIEHILVFLCAHGAKHGWMRLKWICDVAELVRTQQSIDWEGVFQEAERLRSERLLRLGLILSAELVGARLPEIVQTYVHDDREARALAEDVAGRIRSAQVEMERWEESLFWVKSRENARDKLPAVVYYLLRNVTSPTFKDREFVSLPRSLHFLYYLVRPLRVFVDRRESETDSGKTEQAVTSTPVKGEVVQAE